MLINKIKRNRLCVGCGLCSSVLGEDKCKMILADTGFYEPILCKDTNDKIVKKVCPGIRVHSKSNQDVWGSLLYVVEAWSKDDLIRYRAASGGVVTSIAIFLLDSKKVDAILHVGVKDGSSIINELKISKTKDDIINNAQSRYAPALTLSQIVDIFDKTEETYAFIGKPCDIAGMKNLIEYYPQYKKRVYMYISIFCAGMPSYKATEKAWKLSGKTVEPIRLKYRGNGWPGRFKAEWADGDSFEMSYDESWGNILGHDIAYRCKICPDGNGLLSDISVGDAWNTKDGYPDFTEEQGRSIVFARTTVGEKVLREAGNKGYLVIQNLQLGKVNEMQPYQYHRKELVGWRVLPIKLFTLGLISFKGLGLYRAALKANLLEGVMNMLGSIKRLLKTNR